ncbi:uncharacterized protein [Bactrocera oleae]|uniref:uncharacterized protein n=1 Tax=Bactrocera oleae TaxID=104688 RepID=UPI00387E4FEE
MRTELWIPKLKTLIKSIIHQCKTCVLHQKRETTQIMAALPAERTTLTRPFAATGIDFAGPYDIKNYTGRACLITKGYVCVFVCFATKAIHLEAASDLTTQSFMAAFARFFSRRGLTISGAHLNINWHFNSPGAPHMGGLWEAGVKSLKSHLKNVSQIQKFTFEELPTLLTRIESCLNSRPLSPLSEDPRNIEPLTPGHFLIVTWLFKIASNQSAADRAAQPSSYDHSASPEASPHSPTMGLWLDAYIALKRPSPPFEKKQEVPTARHGILSPIHQNAHINTSLVDCVKKITGW